MICRLNIKLNSQLRCDNLIHKEVPQYPDPAWSNGTTTQLEADQLNLSLKTEY
jgi:hypothetical protein